MTGNQNTLQNGVVRANVQGDDNAVRNGAADIAITGRHNAVAQAASADTIWGDYNTVGSDASQARAGGPAAHLRALSCAPADMALTRDRFCQPQNVVSGSRNVVQQNADNNFSACP